jgi:flagellin-like protein
MKNRKGLSGIVTTLIIILLVLVAIGVIWTVVNNLLGKSSGTIQAAQKCLDVDLRATKVVKTNPTAGSFDGYYNVTLSRKPTGEGGVGAKLVFYDATQNTAPVDFGSSDIKPLATITQSVDMSDGGVNPIFNATKVEVTPYFIDDAGKEQLCSTTTSFDFTA